jgi:hypothetical protein
MRSFYLAYRPEGAILSQAVTELGREKLSQAVTELAAPISAQAVPKLKGKKNSAQAVPKLQGEKLPQLVGQFGPAELPGPLAEIPWGHNVLLLFKLADRAERLWYAAQTLAHGWSRAELTPQPGRKPKKK